MKLKNQKILKYGVKNSNGRIYNKGVFEGKLKDTIMGVIGFADHEGESSILAFDKFSHIASNIRDEGDYMIADIEIMSIGEGKVLLDLIEAGYKPKFRTSSMGSIDDDGNVTIDYLEAINVLSPDSEDGFEGLMD